jgi:hypothetical protein
MVARFFLVGTPYQNGINVPNAHKIYQMAVKYSWAVNILTFYVPGHY